MEKKQTQKKIKVLESDEPEEKPKVRKELKRTPLKRSTVPLRKTPLAPIGKKKKERLKNQGSEVDVFLEKWNTSEHFCEVCGCEVKNAFMNGKLVKPQCFAHILSKGMYPRFRLLKENLKLVCSINCHSLCDEMYLDIGLRRELEEEFNLILLQKQSGDQ